MTNATLLPAVVPVRMGTSNAWNSVIVSALFSENTNLRFSIDVRNEETLTASSTALEEISKLQCKFFNVFQLYICSDGYDPVMY